jgi:hypothetical protein
MNSVKHAAVAIACALAVGCANGAAQTKTATQGWVANGLTACDKVLTAEFVAQVLTHPQGHVEQSGSQGCAFADGRGGRIAIILANAGPADFDRHQEYLADPVPLQGVGDKASQTILGIEAFKAPNRMCTIHAGGAPGSLRLQGPALGQKLGGICNQLFSLP